MQEETWVGIPGFSKYEISDLGRVRHIRHKKVLSYNYATNGYPQVNLSWDGKKTGSVCKCVHHLMLVAFKIDRPAGYEINHIDCNKENCSLSNLEVLSRKDHRRLHRRLPPKYCNACGIEIPRSNRVHCSDECRFTAIREKRHCLTCGAEFLISKKYLTVRHNEPRYKNVGSYCSRECFYASRRGVPNLSHFSYHRPQPAMAV